jgi:hypothetical protein
MNSCIIVCSLWTISLRCTLFLSYWLVYGPPFSFSHNIRPFALSLTKFVLDFVLAEDHLAPSLADAHAGAGAGSAPPPPLLQWWFAQSVRSHVCFSAAPGGVAGMVQSTCGKLYRLDRARRMQERGGQL